MSTRTSLRPASVITNGNMASASITSAVTILQSLNKVSYMVNWSGATPIGTLALQFSDDYSINPDGTVNNAGNWVTVWTSVNGVPASSIAISGNTGNAGFDAETGFYASRIVYTKTSGTGTLNATVAGKV